MLAARGGYSEIVQYLIEYGANLNDKNCDGKFIMLYQFYFKPLI